MSGEIIQGLDVVDLLGFVQRKNKTFQAILLYDLEELLGKDSPEFKAARKLVLDSYNNYTRSLLRIIFGDSFESF